MSNRYERWHFFAERVWPGSNRCESSQRGGG